MPQPLGTLYLVPAPLDFACDTQSDIADVLPQLTLVRAASLRHWVVENAKSSRAVLKRIGAVTPLVCSLQEMQLQELPRALHKKGDHSPAQVDGAAVRALLAPLLAGHDMGLMSEAGMPAVADPGSSLVRAAHDMGAQVQTLVGPSSLLLALASSGLSGQSFAFLGYLPQQEPARSERIKQLDAYARKNGQAQLCIETPYRNQALWQALLTHLQPETRLALASGLTLSSAMNLSMAVGAWRKADSALQARVLAALQAPCIFTWGP